MNKTDDVPSRHAARIGQVINAERDSLSPACHTATGEFIQMGQAVCGHQQAVITHHLADVIARPIDMIERNSKAPDEAVLGTFQDFFTQRFAA